jgi:hypothetical protein
VLEHCPADDSVQWLTGQPEPIDQPGQRGGEHVLIRRFGVGTVGARERDAVSAKDGNSASTGCGSGGIGHV